MEYKFIKNNLMSYHILADSFQSYFEEAMVRYKNDEIEALVQDVNKAEAEEKKSQTKKIFDWNSFVNHVQDIRNFLLSFDETLNLPSVKKYFIVFDNMTNRWKLSSEME